MTRLGSCRSPSIKGLNRTSRASGISCLSGSLRFRGTVYLWDGHQRVPKIHNTVKSKRSWHLCSCCQPLNLGTRRLHEGLWTKTKRSYVHVQAVTSTRVIVTFRCGFAAFGGGARSRTEVHGFAMRCIYICFNALQALSRLMTRHLKIQPLMDLF